MSATLITIITLAAMTAIIFFLTGKKERRPNPGVYQVKELTNLYEYKYFLSKARLSIAVLQTKLAAVNYNSLQHETFFRPHEINVLKDDILRQIEELEIMVLVQSISPEEFQVKTDDLQKRINLLTTPLSTLLGTDEGYYETGIGA